MDMDGDGWVEVLCNNNNDMGVGEEVLFTVLRGVWFSWYGWLDW